MKTVLLSYPKSGNTWVRYILERLSGRPSDAKNAKPIGERVGFEVSGDPIVYKRHRMPMRKDRVPYDQLILLVRNWKDAIVSFGWHHNGNVSKRYTHSLRFYDASEKPKLLVYYEDLLTQPEVEVRRLCSFLEIDAGIDDFMANYDTHKNTCIDKCYGYAKTKGDLSVPVEDTEGQWDMAAVEDGIKEILGDEKFNTYLGRYVTEDPNG